MTLCGAYGSGVGLPSISCFRSTGRRLLVLPVGLTVVSVVFALRLVGRGNRMTQLAYVGLLPRPCSVVLILRRSVAVGRLMWTEPTLTLV